MIPKIDYSKQFNTFAIRLDGASWTALHDSAASAHWQETGSAEWTQAARAEMERRTQETRQPLTALETELLGALEGMLEQASIACARLNDALGADAQKPGNAPYVVNDQQARAAIAKATRNPAA